MKIVLLLLSALIFWAGSCNFQRVRPDNSLSAAEAGDYTALIEGCGNSLIAGYTYCRKIEGDASNEVIYFVAPKTDCVGEGPCTTFKVFYPDGSPSLGGNVPRGTTRSAIKWSELIKKDRFEISDRGFWQYTYDIKWIDLEGREHLTRSFGEIRMRVLPKTYVALDSVKEDQNFVWSWVENGVPVKMTTGARTYVGPKP